MSAPDFLEMVNADPRLAAFVEAWVALDDEAAARIEPEDSEPS